MYNESTGVTINDIVIAEDTLKHGLSEKDIIYAWENFVRKRYRGAPNEGEIVAIGYDKHGRFIQLVAAERSCGIVIYYAMQPPTLHVLKELELVR